MIKSLVRAYLINVFALWVTSQVFGGFHLSDGWRSLLIVGLGFTLLHLIIRPILSLVLGPVNFLTLGLVGLFLDAGILYFLTLNFPQVSTTPWLFTGFSSAYLVLPPYQFTNITSTVLSSLIINIIRSSLSAIFL